MKEICKSFKETVFKSIDHFVPHKILRKNPDPEYYNKEVKQLMAKSTQQEKIRTVISRELKRLSKEWRAVKKKTAQQTFLRSVLRNEGNCCSEFYKYAKRQKGNREIIPVIKDHNRTIIIDSTEKANILNSYSAYIFGCDQNIPKIQLANSGVTFIINTKIIRKKLAKIGG